MMEWADWGRRAAWVVLAGVTGMWVGAAQAQEGGPAAAAVLLPHDPTPWGMFQAASPVVQAVMLGLALASVATWTVWLAKSIELRVAKRRLRAALDGLEQLRGLGEAAQTRPLTVGPAAEMLRAAVLEQRLSADGNGDGLKERVESRLSRIEAAAARRIAAGTGLLASIGSVGPFVGLFGTVWGIMTAFIGISKAHTTNLAVVAPGIAEALLATAIGLVAAIPAVVIYNLLSRAIGGYRAQLADTAASVLRHLSRDLDRGDAGAGPVDLHGMAGGRVVPARGAPVRRMAAE